MYTNCFLNCGSVAQLCRFFNPMNCSTPGFSVLHYLPEFAQIHVHWFSDAIQPTHPWFLLLLLPSVFPSMRVFFSESTLCIRWPVYWSFSFSISPSSEYSGLISFRISLFVTLGIFYLPLSQPPPFHTVHGRKAMINLDSILKSRDVSLTTMVPSSQSCGFSSGHVWIWELDCHHTIGQ